MIKTFFVTAEEYQKATCLTICTNFSCQARCM